MKLQLLHGPAISISRKKLTEIKKKYQGEDLVTFEGNFSEQEVLGSLMTMPLLSTKRVVVLENPSESFDLTDINVQSDLVLILWFDHEISESKPIFKFVKESNGEVFFFPEAKELSVFPLLDHLGNRDKKAYLEIDKLKKGGFDTQYLITMILYLLRSLAVFPKGAPKFVLDKLKKQRVNFKDEEIKDIYRYVLETDFKIKSGLIEKDQAEFLLVNRFIEQKLPR